MSTIKECARFLGAQVEELELSAALTTTKTLGDWACERLNLGRETWFVCTRTEGGQQTICKGLNHMQKVAPCRRSEKQSQADLVIQSMRRNKKASSSVLWSQSMYSKSLLIHRPLTKQVT